MGSRKHDKDLLTNSKRGSYVSMTTTKMPGVEELQRTANVTLREAMSNERSRRWSKVVHNYRSLLRMLNKRYVPPDVVFPPSHSMMLYEVYYHLGLALQQLGEHGKAVQLYGKAIEAVFVPKNGCQAGCNSNSCLMTPLYARRAFAYAKAGDLASALRDAEKTVVLDNKNPALQDVKTALRYDASHLCALILKGRLEGPQIYDEWLDPGKKSENKDHIKACGINPDCHNFLSVQDFNHKDILSFYERFLYSLSIPHTICELTFTSRKSRAPSRVSSARSLDPRACHQEALDSASRGFRCGTPALRQDGHDSAASTQRRRRVYGEAVREHAARPKTADQYMSYLEKQRLKKQITESRDASRSAKSPTVGSTRFQDTASARPRPVTQRPVEHHNKPSVFVDMNLKHAPRMYYRPWLGDKLPVAEVERKQWINPPFK